MLLEHPSHTPSGLGGIMVCGLLLAPADVAHGATSARKLWGCFRLGGREGGACAFLCTWGAACRPCINLHGLDTRLRVRHCLLLLHLSCGWGTSTCRVFQLLVSSLTMLGRLVWLLVSVCQQVTHPALGFGFPCPPATPRDTTRHFRRPSDMYKVVLLHPCSCCLLWLPTVPAGNECWLGGPVFALWEGLSGTFVVSSVGGDRDSSANRKTETLKY